MGLQGVYLPDELVGRVAQVLRDADIAVDEQPMTPDEAKVFVALFRCTSQQGAVVTVSLQRAKSSSPCDTMAVLRPEWPDGHGRRATDALVREIMRVLKENGAIDPRLNVRL